MKKKKLLIVAKFIDGGTVVGVQTLLKLQDRYPDMFTVHAAVLCKPRFRRITQMKRYSFFGREPYPKKYALFSRFLITFIREIAWLKKIVGKHAPDVVVSVDIHAGLLTELVKINRLWFRHVATLHNNVTGAFREKTSVPLGALLRVIFGWVLRRADSVTCISSDLAAAVYQEFGLRKKPVTIYGGESFNNHGAVFEQKNRSHILLSVGRLAPQKDPLTLIRAFTEVLKKEPRARLWMVGDGELRNVVSKAIRVLPRGSVTLWGWRQHPTAFMKRADVFVLSSVREGFPFVILEALSCGLPIVATDAPFGASEMLDRGRYGRLTPVGDHRVLANAILAALRDRPSIAFRKRLIARSKVFSEKRMLDSYHDLLVGV